MTLRAMKMRTNLVTNAKKAAALALHIFDGAITHACVGTYIILGIFRRYTWQLGRWRFLLEYICSGRTRYRFSQFLALQLKKRPKLVNCYNSIQAASSHLTLSMICEKINCVSSSPTQARPSYTQPQRNTALP